MSATKKHKKKLEGLAENLSVIKPSPTKPILTTSERVRRITQLDAALQKVRLELQEKEPATALEDLAPIISELEALVN